MKAYKITRLDILRMIKYALPLSNTVAESVRINCASSTRSVRSSARFRCREGTCVGRPFLWIRLLDTEFLVGTPALLVKRQRCFHRLRSDFPFWMKDQFIEFSLVSLSFATDAFVIYYQCYLWCASFVLKVDRLPWLRFVWLWLIICLLLFYSDLLRFDFQSLFCR